MDKIFFKGTIENIWMTNKLMSICSTLLNSRKIKKKKRIREKFLRKFHHHGHLSHSRKIANLLIHTLKWLKLKC